MQVGDPPVACAVRSSSIGCFSRRTYPLHDGAPRGEGNHIEIYNQTSSIWRLSSFENSTFEVSEISSERPRHAFRWGYGVRLTQRPRLSVEEDAKHVLLAGSLDRTIPTWVPDESLRRRHELAGVYCDVPHANSYVERVKFGNASGLNLNASGLH